MTAITISRMRLRVNRLILARLGSIHRWQMIYQCFFFFVEMYLWSSSTTIPDQTSLNMNGANGSLPICQPFNIEGRSYSLAITGKSFALVHDHCPELLERVSGGNILPAIKSAALLLL